MDVQLAVILFGLQGFGMSEASRARVLRAVPTFVHVVHEQSVSRLSTLYGAALCEDDPQWCRTKLARLLGTWDIYESGLDARAVGDSGASFGVGQVNPSTMPASVEHRWTRGELLASAHNGLSAQVDVLVALVGECGSLRSALGAYASGKCGGARDLVERRCRESHGGC